ncbi:ORF6N domain-containing protein [Aneurinibacillus migulanus]|uniref:Antirepressor n=1 Tax=Aneurinibacillus migulanus TaxID=47500 RepID=A0A0D1XZQ1_ANEMI|nr:ORF6N domain-containing protein [Aneurinibacillus migulanus]KIV57523.1 antirepressor [Aneurinibacillus migulanus]KON94860.1 antirepressor [Aneurinibacillus migulanus]MED0892878.1 ORF6N domain-containing protein [Aneurinibacillus migulanus]MED1619124.1 ORF6N domain-containing protein [Aneurinibacillus migulanus]SDI91797.1 ORF6N domain-containing protein [Aneurinibacillus migulanus]
MNNLTVIEHRGQRVLTTLQLAESYKTDAKHINDNFQNNRKRYTLGKHYFELKDEELKNFKATTKISGNLKFAPVIYLWTEKGAWMHAKSLNTDKAWEAYEMLVDEYYRMKEQTIDVSMLGPELQMFKHLFDGVAKVQIESLETKRQLSEVKTTVNVIQETFLQRDSNWRKSINSMLNQAASRLGGEYRELRNDSYQKLEERGRCNLNVRLTNLKERLSENGATKTKINQTTKMDVIESDARLKEIYTTIVKELSIGSLSK